MFLALGLRGSFLYSAASKGNNVSENMFAVQRPCGYHSASVPSRRDPSRREARMIWLRTEGIAGSLTLRKSVGSRVDTVEDDDTCESEC